MPVMGMQGAPQASDETWLRLQQRVAQQLGIVLPGREALGTPGFDAAMRVVRERDPALWREILDELCGPDTRLPVEQEALEAERRERFRARLLGPFLRADRLRTGVKRLNVRRIVNAAAAAVILFGVLWTLTGGQRTSPPAIGTSVQQPQPAPRPQPAPTAAPAPVGRPAPSPQPAASPLPPAPPPAEAGLVLPPAIPSLPQLPATAPTVAAPSQPAGGQGAVVFRAEATGGTSPVVFRRDQAAEDRETGSTAAPASTVVFRAGGSGAGGSPSGLPSDTPVVFRVGSTGTAAGQGPLTPAPPAPSPAPEQPPPHPAASPSPGPRFHLGQVLQVKLALPVSVSPAWGAVPVVAELVGGPHAGALLWGQARMARDGSVEMGFTQLIVEGRMLPFSGMAYDATAGKPGVSGQVETVLPGAAQTLLGGALQAASEYFKARVNARTVTITNGWVTIQQQEPSFWDVYSKMLAEAMTPATQATGPTVVVRLPAGAVISVIVTGQ